MSYEEFLRGKARLDTDTGLTDPPALPACMFDFQYDITRWALRRGRAAIFAGTGMGKTLIELAWASAVASATGFNALIIAPLAVAEQTVREAAKFGLAAHRIRGDADIQPGISVTNYQRLDSITVERFGAVVLDESSILKSLDGKIRTTLVRRCANIPFRLAATATPAPNDFG